jgi:hypothetical protein
MRENPAQAEGQSNCAELFLTQLYTTNCQDRYGNWLEDTREETGEEALSAAMERYYDSLAGLAAEELLDKLQANREPMKYDKLDWENGTEWKVEQVLLEPADEKGRQKFSVERKQGSGAETDRREGVIGVDAATGKVNYFWEKK